MGLFSKKPSLAGGQPLQPVEYLCKLQEETNSLLRELLSALTGNAARTPHVKLEKPPLRTFTDKDVTQVTRADRMRQQLEREAQTAAPWRTSGAGRASETTSPTAGSAPNGANNSAPTPEDPAQPLF